MMRPRSASSHDRARSRRSSRARRSRMSSRRPDQELAARGEVHGLDRVEAGEVVGVLDGDADACPPAARRARTRSSSGSRRRRAASAPRGSCARWLPDGAVVELGRAPAATSSLGTCISSIRILATSSWLTRAARDRLLDVLLGDEALVDERAELRGLVGARGAVLVVEGDAEDLARAPRPPRRPWAMNGAAAALVDELQHAQQVLVEHDRRREDLRGLEAGGLVPARVEPQARVEPGELGGVVGVRDVGASCARAR